jgi:hypothetical protein
MKTLRKILLSTVLTVFAFVPANAGEMTLSGSMEISATTGLSGSNSGGRLGQENELSVTGSTELDDGTTVSYKQSITADNARNDSELVFGTSYGTISMTSTGTPIDAIDNKTPTAFEEGFHGATTWTQVGQNDGTFGIRFKNADVLPLGLALDFMYFPTVGAGDAANDEGTSGTSSDEYDNAYDVAISGAVPFVDGASFGVGYATADSGTTTRGDREEGTAYLNYAYGPLSLGAQFGLVAYDIKTQVDAGSDTAWVKNTYYGVSYAVNDNLSVSYQNNQSQKHTKADGSLNVDGSQGTSVIQESDGFSVAYTLGGMTIAYVDNSHDNESYGSTEKDYRQIVVGVAF